MKYLYLIAVTLLILSACGETEIASTTSAIFSDRCIFSHDLKCEEYTLSNESMDITLKNNQFTELEILDIGIYKLGPETDRVSKRCETNIETVSLEEEFSINCDMGDLTDIRRNTFRVFIDSIADGEEIRLEGDLFFSRN